VLGTQARREVRGWVGFAPSLKTSRRACKNRGNLRGMAFFRARTALAVGIAALLSNWVLAGCSGGFYQCLGQPLSCGERSGEQCQGRAAGGCLAGPACEPPVCAELHGADQCASSPLCAWHSGGESGLVCRSVGGAECVSSVTQTQCESHPGCLWRTACHGTAATCDGFDTQSACGAVPGCLWMRHEDA